MSLVIERDGTPVHFPKSDAFRFDEEVAEIFENMAVRSIPMYGEIHRLHCQMLAYKMMGPESVVFDIGASTGRWFRTMRKVLGVETLDQVAGLKTVAFDNSNPMLEKLKKEFPEVDVRYLDLENPTTMSMRADVSVMFYVLQFVPDKKKEAALRWAYHHTKPGGVLILGQKENFGGEQFQQEYIRFRLANGYTQEEIDAKTAALKNSMCMLLNLGFSRVVETTRWLQFSTYMAIK
jgi:tRNA (cmo5U34)-methyltransferase